MLQHLPKLIVDRRSSESIEYPDIQNLHTFKEISLKKYKLLQN